MKRKVSSIALNALLLILGVVTVYPFVWMLFSSFKENQEIMALEQHLLPQKFIIDNYINMNAHFNFIRFFLNSIVITVVITLIVIYTRTICGFVLSKYKFNKCSKNSPTSSGGEMNCTSEHICSKKSL